MINFVLFLFLVQWIVYFIHSIHCCGIFIFVFLVLVGFMIRCFLLVSFPSFLLIFGFNVFVVWLYFPRFYGCLVLKIFQLLLAESVQLCFYFSVYFILSYLEFFLFENLFFSSLFSNSVSSGVYDLFDNVIFTVFIMSFQRCFLYNRCHIICLGSGKVFMLIYFVQIVLHFVFLQYNREFVSSFHCQIVFQDLFNLY